MCLQVVKLQNLQKWKQGDVQDAERPAAGLHFNVRISSAQCLSRRVNVGSS